MGAYTDDDKDSDAALLDSLEGVVRADTKRMLARVADDDEIPVALLRRMALKAGATLDCFVKMHRKKRRAVELTDKHAIVRQLLRPKGAVRLAGAGDWAGSRGRGHKRKAKQVAEARGWGSRGRDGRSGRGANGGAGDGVGHARRGPTHRRAAGREDVARTVGPGVGAADYPRDDLAAGGAADIVVAEWEGGGEGGGEGRSRE